MDAAFTYPEASDHAVQIEFSTAEAAVFLGCSAGYLQNLRQIGDGPPYHRPWKRKGIYYVRPDFEKWRMGRRYLSTSEY